MPTSYPASSVATAQHHGDTRRAFRTRTTISTRKPCASFPTWKRWALSIAFGWSQLDRPEPAKFCTADGYVQDSGETLTRDPDQDCAWVGTDGKPVPLDADGNPTG